MTQNKRNDSSDTTTGSSIRSSIRSSKEITETMALDNSKMNNNKVSQAVPEVEGYIIKMMKDLSVSKTSVATDDFVETLNIISPKLGGLTNLGVFCDIISIEQSSAVLSDVEEQFIHVDTLREEQPYNKLSNDGSSVNPYDFSFYYLLNE